MRIKPPPAVVNHDGHDGADVLADFDAWCAAVGAPVVPLTPDRRRDVSGFDDPRAVVGDLHAAWVSWVAARAAYAAEHGWPGGDDVRHSQESAAYPGEPFDPWKDL